MCTEFGWENLLESSHLEEPGGGGTILKWIFRKKVITKQTSTNIMWTKIALSLSVLSNIHLNVRI